MSELLVLLSWIWKIGTGIRKWWLDKKARDERRTEAPSSQLRIAALEERRLEADQHACTLTHKLRFADKHKEIGDMVLVCQDWFINNCLYLSPSKREAFPKAYQSALLHAELLRVGATPELLRVARQNFKDAGKLLGVS